MDDNPIYAWIPQYMIKLIKKQKCSKCSITIEKSGIISVGIRQLENDNKCLSIEYQCKHCNHKSMVLFNNKTGTYQEMCYILVDEIKKRSQTQKSLHNEKKSTSSMGDDEINEFLTAFRKLETHEDFMKYIGCPDSIQDNNNADQN